MSALKTLAFSPFTLLFRHSYAHPWTAVAISAALGVAAHFLSSDAWASLFVSFMAYMMIYIAETTRPAEPAAAGG